MLNVIQQLTFNQELFLSFRRSAMLYISELSPQIIGGQIMWLQYLVQINVTFCHELKVRINVI